MRIAQVAPLYESTPPQAYGPTERIVSYLTEALLRQGHEVTLFASGDSQTSAELVAVCPRGLWRDRSVRDTLTHHLRQLEAVAQRADDFDVLHFHGDPFHLPLARRLRCRHLTTLHGRLLPADHGPLFREFADAPLVSISDDQRRQLPRANWLGTVYHGLPADAFTLREEPDDYLLFIGRMMPEKRPDLAIEIARRSGLPLKMAAKIHFGGQGYFDQTVQPLLQQSKHFVDYLSEVGGREREQLFAGARALLFPVEWPEPFGMVMIEAMACGTPVIAFGRGAVPEVIEDGVNGIIVDGVDDAVQALQRLQSLSRRRCREIFEQRFTDERMARDYVALYRQLLAPAGSGAAMQTVAG